VDVAHNGRVYQVDGAAQITRATDRVLSRVVAPIARPERLLYDLTYTDRSGTEQVIQGTEEHPFYVGGEWVSLIYLRPGDRLQSGPTQVGVVTDVRPSHRAPVFN
jgi:hypothetical protein